jgi:DNA-binding transcriptional LysR family regulator
MQLSSVRIFADVMSLGSFASAARQRDLDPSSISRAIAGLEKELGFRLFQRNRRKLAPTEAGAHYYAQIKGLLEDIERAGQEALDLTTEPRGMLRVTACTSMGQRVLAALLPKLFEAYPALSLDLVLTDAQVDLVADQIDLAIRFGLEPEGDVIAAELVPRRFRVCASPAYVQREGAMLHSGELSERDCILFPLPGYRTRWRFRNNSGEEVAVPVRGRLLVSHGLTNELFTSIMIPAPATRTGFRPRCCRRSPVPSGRACAGTARPGRGGGTGGLAGSPAPRQFSA